MHVPTRKTVALLIAAIAVSSSVFAFAYLANGNRVVPNINSANTIHNVTIAEHFLNYTQGTSPPTPLYSFNATTAIMFRNNSSYLTINERVAPFVDPAVGYTEMNNLNIIITGNLSRALHATGIKLTVSDVGPYNNTWADESVLSSEAYPPFSNVTAPSLSSLPAMDHNYTLNANYKFVKVPGAVQSFVFGAVLGIDCNFYYSPGQSNFGTHILKVEASLIGLSVPVNVTINLMLVDKG